MLENHDLKTQLEHAASDPLRTLVVGAGVSGASLAALMRRRGRRPVLIERAQLGTSEGYMLGLLPLGGNLLRTLDRYPDYLDASRGMDTYTLGDGRGRPLRSLSMGELFSGSGAYRGIDRGVLVELLLGEAAVSWATTVADIAQRPDVASVTFSDGTVADFDVVIAADGLHSTTRGLVQPAGDLTTFDSKWAGWVVWAPLGDQNPSTYSEYWGAGSFVGFYPVLGRVGLFVGGPTRRTERGPRAFAAEVRKRGPLGAQIATALDALEAAPDPFYWKFADARSARLAYGRVVLLGDAGVGFLPTAGVGAAMAMDSAGALDDELSRSGPAEVEFTLGLYERRQRDRLRAAQTDSRRLAQVMFTNNRFSAWVVRQTLRRIPLNTMLGGIRKVIERR
jgi:salicylate hydroxylase